LSLKKPLTEAQLEANRANSKKSTGPISIEGKRRSSQNAFKQGLTGATALLPSDNRDAYEDYVNEIVADLRPGSLLEHEICRDVADAHWRLRRIRSVECKMLTLEAVVPPPVQSPPPDHFHNHGRESFEPIPYIEVNDDTPYRTREQDLHTAARLCLDAPNAIPNISLYEQRIQRGIKNSMEELRRLRAERESRLKREMPEALKHYKLQLMQDLPFDPATHGFVFSFDEIHSALELEILQKQAAYALQIKYDLETYQKRYPKRAA
jgi:hypothetical protein